MADVLTEAARLGLRWGRADGVLVTRAEFVAEAREWVGTPFVHQRETKGVGADCGGLVRGVSVALGLLPTDYKTRIPRELHGYPRRANGPLARQLCDHYWRAIDLADVQPGDVVLITWTGDPAHAAIVGDYAHGGLSLIHAVGPMHPARVVEHRIDKTWRARIVAAYSIPGVE